jgi:hypothetical protein
VTKAREFICENDGATRTRKLCRSCALYNAAVAGAETAAQRFAESVDPRAKRAWVNQYGIFAYVDGVSVQLGSAEEAAPFDQLTTSAVAAARRLLDAATEEA